MATRTIRWIEGFKGGEQSFRWNQLKRLQHPKKPDKSVELVSDRQVEFVYTLPNEDYVSPETQPDRSKLTAAQKKEHRLVHSYTKETREKLQARVDELIALIQNIADGTVTSFFYSAEGGVLRYREELVAEGTTITEEVETTDETLVTAAHDLALELASTIQVESKPLSVAEPMELTAGVDGIEEPAVNTVDEP